MGKCIAIVLAAGQGKRMNAKVHKQYLLIQDKPVLYYSLRAFEESNIIDEIVMVTGDGEEEYCKQEIVDKYNFSKVGKIVIGGKERYHSVYQGLMAIDACDYVFIHDGARPFVSETILERCCEAVEQYQACVAGVRVKDTVKIEDGNGMIASTPNRNVVWTVQTPQVFAYPLIKDAYEKLLQEEHQLLEKGIVITDDTMVVETFSDCKIKIVEGDYTNIKITTPEDLTVAEIFAKK